MTPMLRRAGVLTLVVVACAPTAAASAQEVTQKQLAERILTAPVADKAQAVAQVFSIPVDSREPGLEAALVQELLRLNEDDRNRWMATKEGKPFQPEGPAESEYRMAVARLVGESRNPGVVPALVGALGSVAGIGSAIVRFEDKAVAPLVAAARAAHPNYAAPAEALSTLRLLIESGKRMTDPSFAQIISVAGQRMSGQQYFGHVIAAIDLGIATNDDRLRARVTQLSADSFQIRQMGITDPKQAQRVRDAAAAALKK